jgi:hypothetical protein
VGDYSTSVKGRPMSIDKDSAELNQDTGSAANLTGPTSRRRLLQLGAVAAPAAIMLKPGHAWAASVFQCSVAVPTILGNVNGGWVPIRSIPTAIPGQAQSFNFFTGADGPLVTVSAVDSGGLGTYTGEQLRPGGTFNSTQRPGQYAFLLTLSTGQGLSCLQSIGFA